MVEGVACHALGGVFGTAEEGALLLWLCGGGAEKAAVARLGRHGGGAEEGCAGVGWLLGALAEETSALLLLLLRLVCCVSEEARRLLWLLA